MSVVDKNQTRSSEGISNAKIPVEKEFHHSLINSNWQFAYGGVLISIGAFYLPTTKVKSSIVKVHHVNV